MSSKSSSLSPMLEYLTQHTTPEELRQQISAAFDQLALAATSHECRNVLCIDIGEVLSHLMQLRDTLQQCAA